MAEAMGLAGPRQKNNPKAGYCLIGAIFYGGHFESWRNIGD